MAQWQELLNLDSAHQDQVIQVYINHNFPWDIRRIFSDWIASQNWESAASDERQASDVFHELLQQLDDCYSRLVRENNLLEGPNYLLLRNNVQTLFEVNPVNMALIISRCLSEERRIIASAMHQDCTANGAAMESKTSVDNYIRDLNRNIQDGDGKIKSIDEQFGKYDMSLKQWLDEVDQLNGSPVSPDLQRTKMNIDSALFDLFQTRLDVGHLMVNTVELSEWVVSTVVEKELQSWKHRQQLACIGAPHDTSLQNLQTWFTSAAKALNLQLQQLSRLQELDQQCLPNDLLLSQRTQCEETTKCLLTKLLKNALVVETQPCMVISAQRPLILKTGVRFAVKTRFLVNHSTFNWMPKVTLVFDKDFDEIGAVNGFRKFSFTNKAVSKLLEVTDTGLVAHFDRLSLEDKSKNSRQNKSPLAVTEELHFITCMMELKVTDSTLDIETSTLPLVIMSSTNQTTAAWASILWSAMVVDHQPKNLLFLAPPPVAWQQLSVVLSWQFQAMSGRGLDEQQLDMLREKFVDNQDNLVCWNKFFKCDGSWVWIEGVLDLINRHLLAIWRDGHIMGFVSRETAETLLLNKPKGTFLLRFSESIKEGAITFSWVDHSKAKGSHVYAVEPYTKVDLAKDSLAKVIRTYRLQSPSNRMPLLYLYPDIPKDQAFQQYYSQPVKSKDGYVPRDTEHVSPGRTPSPLPEENMLPSVGMEFHPMDVESSELLSPLSDILEPLDLATIPYEEQTVLGWTERLTE